jgi:Ion channel
MNHPAKGAQKHLALLCLLLLLFVLSPFVVLMRYGELVVNTIGAAVLLSGTYTINRRKKLFAISVVLSIATVVVDCLMVFYSSEGLVLLSNALPLVLLALFSVSILGNVLRAGQVTADKIYGALCVYLIIGYAWTFAYAILDQVQPGSFAGPDENSGISEHVARVMRMRYFSFVTLTTVGFGDIIPRSPAARTFATLEAVMGQIYLAVLVARLVGLHIVHGSKPGDESK